jgi:hypothetical protein
VVASGRVTIPVVALFVDLYVLALFFGSMLYGQRWFAAADPFEVYATLMATLSPWSRDEAGTVVLRWPLTNLASLTPAPGTVAFVAVLLGSTANDGFSNSTIWVSWIQQQPIPSILAATLTLVGITAIVAITFTAAARLSSRLTRSPLAGEA